MNRDDLLGTWDLQRFWFTDDDGTEMDPLGDSPVGNLILGADGNYAFTMMRAGRSPYAGGDLLAGTAAEKGEAADGYVSFGGAWTFGDDAITFGIAYSLFPWLVIDNLTIWNAAAAPESLLVIFIGAALVLPIVIAYSIRLRP